MKDRSPPPLRVLVTLALLCTSLLVAWKQQQSTTCFRRDMPVTNSLVSRHQHRSSEVTSASTATNITSKLGLDVSAVTKNRLPSFRFGSLGPEGKDSRKNMMYYDLLFVLSIEFGHSARKALEVGCASDPFVKHLYWISDKTCIAPYSAYGKQTPHSVNMTKVDFMKWQWKKGRDDPFDLVVCSQVVEHVDDPKAFVQKLLAVSRTLIVSVPYKWSKASTSKKSNHISHDIDETTILGWAKPNTPVVTARIGGERQRLIAVFVRGR